MTIEVPEIITTNKIIVTGVSEQGCAVAVNGAALRISWAALTAAALQEDTYLAPLYRSIRDEACAMVRENDTLPITCSVQQDETNVWWVAKFHDISGEWFWIPRAAHEGGTLAHKWMAQQEAKDRTARLRNLGYTVI